jgi:hypothetical protein
MASNHRDSSASMFMSLPAPDCLITHYGHHTWPLTAMPCLATHGYHSPSQASTRLRIRTHLTKVKVMLQLMVSLPVSLGVKPHLGPKTRFLLLSDNYGFVDVRHPLWWKDRSVIYDCCWPSPAQTFLHPLEPLVMSLKGGAWCQDELTGSKLPVVK